MRLRHLVMLTTLAGFSSGCAYNTAAAEKVRAQLLDSKVTLVEAIDLAAAETPEGVTLEAELGEHDGAVCYAVTRYQSSTSAVFVELASGTVAATQSMSAHDAQALALAQKMSAASISTEDAIAIAEDRVGGQAFEAELEDEDGETVYEVEVLADGEDVIYEVEISLSGEVLEVEKEDEEDEDEDEDGPDDDD